MEPGPKKPRLEDSKESEQSPAPPTLADLKKKWDGKSDNYAKNFEVWSLPGYQLLFANLQLHGPPMGWAGKCHGPQAPTSVIDVGCGPGGALAQILDQVPDNCSYTATDYSEAMCAKARKSLSSRVTVQQADAAKLPFPDASFDRYVSNLCLMVVPDFDQAVHEAARVLKPGSTAAFTLWGRREKSHYFSIQTQAMKDLGMTYNSGFDKPTRDNFHIVDKGSDSLRERVKACGFDKVVVWYTTLAHGHVDGKDYAAHRLNIDRGNKSLVGLSEEQMAQLEKEMAIRGDALIEKGEPLGLDVAVVIARRAFQ